MEPVPVLMRRVRRGGCGTEIASVAAAAVPPPTTATRGDGGSGGGGLGDGGGGGVDVTLRIVSLQWRQ